MTVKVVTVSNVISAFPDPVVTVEWGATSRQELDCTGWFYEPQIGDVLWVDMDSVKGQPFVCRVLTKGRVPNLQRLALNITTTTPSGMQAASSVWVSPGMITAVVAPSPTPTNGQQVFAPSSSDTWDPTNGWRREALCRQGVYPGGSGPAKGLWFYGANAFAALSGRTLTGISITIERAEGVGSPYAPKTIYVVGHTYAGEPAGEPAIVGSYAVGKLGTGDRLTFPLPLSVATGLQSGALAGVGVSSASGADYLAVLGAGTGSGQLTITWSA